MILTGAKNSENYSASVSVSGGIYKVQLSYKT